MTIYRLTVNEVEADPIACISSYKSPRILRGEQFFATKDLAEAKRKEIYDGSSKLLGFIPRIEISICEIEVIEI